MRPARFAWQTVLEPLVGRRITDRRASQETDIAHATQAADAQRAETVPAADDDSDRLDRERHLRVLMSSWM
jgi:hypothetical protein